MYVPEDKHKKLNVKVIEVVLVGYEPGSKGYQLWDHSTHSFKLSWDVTFDEASFPLRPTNAEATVADTSETTLPPLPLHFYPATAEPNQPAEP